MNNKLFGKQAIVVDSCNIESFEPILEVCCIDELPKHLYSLTIHCSLGKYLKSKVLTYKNYIKWLCCLFFLRMRVVLAMRRFLLKGF